MASCRTCTKTTGKCSQAKINRFYQYSEGTFWPTVQYPLGPQTVNKVHNLFEIPPELPPKGGWVTPNLQVDEANAAFDTSDLPPGKYQLKLELFDSNGKLVDIAAAGIKYLVPGTEVPGPRDDAATLELVLDNSFIMTLHVDNRHTSGALQPPRLDSNQADPCGVLRYTPGVAGPSGSVTMEYTASHPDNFAVFTYRLSRGATALTPPTTTAKVSAATEHAVVTVDALKLLSRDGQVCDVAGFGEDLYVRSLATDGWSWLYQYDNNPPPLGFALAPQKE